MDRPFDVCRCGRCGREFCNVNLYFAPDEYCNIAFMEAVARGEEPLKGDWDEAAEYFADRRGFFCADCMEDVARILKEGDPKEKGAAA